MYGCPVVFSSVLTECFALAPVVDSLTTCGDSVLFVINDHKKGHLRQS